MTRRSVRIPCAHSVNKDVSRIGGRAAHNGPAVDRRVEGGRKTRRSRPRSGCGNVRRRGVGGGRKRQGIDGSVPPQRRRRLVGSRSKNTHADRRVDFWEWARERAGRRECEGGATREAFVLISQRNACWRNSREDDGGQSLTEG